jgi:hypothetical protein
MTNTYIDCITYSKAPTGIILTNQVGNIGRIASVAAGATLLTLVAPTTVALNQYDALYVTDGPNSEVLQVGSTALIGSTTISLQQATQFAHTGGSPYCTDGIQGSLGQSIFEASQWIEDICHQALWNTTYTGEILTMPTMRAAIDNQWNLHFRPRHFPITALSSVSVQVTQAYTVTLDATQAIIDSDQQTVDIPSVNTLSSTQPQGGPYLWQPFNRQSNGWITLSYTAGFPVGLLPWAVTRAATLLTSDCFGQISNPVGADQINQGKRQVMFMLRGDTSGESLLRKQAISSLGPYIAQSF